jgi:hypothetical protein
MPDARRAIETWRIEYRPHRSLADLTPEEYAERSLASEKEEPWVGLMRVSGRYDSGSTHHVEDESKNQNGSKYAAADVHVDLQYVRPKQY